MRYRWSYDGGTPRLLAGMWAFSVHAVDGAWEIRSEGPLVPRQVRVQEAHLGDVQLLAVQMLEQAVNLYAVLDSMDDVIQSDCAMPN